MEPNFEADDQELDNEVVTVSKLQVALRATAQGLPAQLSALALSADTSTQEGLIALLQQATALLLDQSQHWTHVLASSQTVSSRETAESLFSQLSLRERRKFSAETLTNVDGVIRRQTIVAPALDQHSDYIVVTLLLGTADDQPLFEAINSVIELREALSRLKVMQSAYLMVFELLWSPQADTDVLTADDLASEYGDLISIAENDRPSSL